MANITIPQPATIPQPTGEYIMQDLLRNEIASAIDDALDVVESYQDPIRKERALSAVVNSGVKRAAITGVDNIDHLFAMVGSLTELKRFDNVTEGWLPVEYKAEAAFASAEELVLVHGRKVTSKVAYHNNGEHNNGDFFVTHVKHPTQRVSFVFDDKGRFLRWFPGRDKDVMVKRGETPVACGVARKEKPSWVSLIKERAHSKKR